MSAENQDISKSLYHKAIEFMQLGSEGGVNSFNMVGPIDVPTYFNDFAALFPKAGGEFSFAIIATTPNRERSYFYDRILGLEIPERIRALRMVDDVGIRTLFESIYTLGNLPSIVLAFGETRDMREECLLLFCVAGRSPESALRLLQDAVRERKSSRN